MQATTSTTSSSGSCGADDFETDEYTDDDYTDDDYDYTDDDYDDIEQLVPSSTNKKNNEEEVGEDYDSDYDSDDDHHYENPSNIGKENGTANLKRPPTLASSSAENTPPTKPCPARATATETADDADENDDEDGKPAAQPETCKVKWEKKEYVVEKPHSYNLGDCIKNFYRKSNIEQALANANPEQKEKLQKLDNIIISYFTEQDRRSDSTWDWNPRRLVGNKPVVYAGVFESANGPNSAEDPGGHKIGKVGMSFTGRDRVKRQNLKFAAQLMDQEDMEKAVSDEWVQAIKELHLPSIIFHKGQKDKEELFIRMHLCETYLACKYECRGLVAERFTQLPNADVQAATAVPTFTPAALQFMRGIPDGGVFCILSWATLRSFLQKMKIASPNFLAHRLPEEATEGGFVKWNLLIRLLGDKLGAFKDAVDPPPRVVKLDGVVGDLTSLLKTKKEIDNDAIRKALLPLQGEYYRHYERPSQALLAAGAKPVLGEKLVRLPRTHVIFVERHTMMALDEEEGDWLDRVLYMNRAMDLVEGDPWALCLVPAKTGHRVVITASYFMAFAEEANQTARIRSVRAFIHCSYLLQFSGNIDAQDASLQREVLCAFLMGMTLDDEDTDTNGFRAARNPAFPKGYFPQSPPNVMIVSQDLHIGPYETLYIREELGPKRMNKVLQAHGLQVPTPLDPDWKCPGPPACPGIKAEQCKQNFGAAGAAGGGRDDDTDDDDDDDDENEAYACMVGRKEPNHVFRGLYLCNKCHRKMERREMATLQKQLSDMCISTEGLERLLVLQKSSDNKRVCTNQGRQRNIDTQGFAAVQEGERAKSRTFLSRQTEYFAENLEARADHLEKKKDENKKRMANGGEPKPPGERRQITSKNARYPDDFKKKLTTAAEHFVRLFDQTTVPWNFIVALFDRLLERERLEGMVVPLAPSGRFKYIDHEYRKAVENILAPIVYEKPGDGKTNEEENDGEEKKKKEKKEEKEEKPKKWMVRNPSPQATAGTKKNKIKGKEVEAIYDHVINLMYPSEG